MPAKKKKEEKPKTNSDQEIANANAIGSLTEVAENQHDRLNNLEEKLDSIMSKLGQVLSRLGL